MLHLHKCLEALKEFHVDVTGEVATLGVVARESNGIIRGLRGTGKSHLMLITRDDINSSKEHLCIYINLQEHLSIGGNIIVQEKFYVWVLLKQLEKQIKYIIEDGKDKSTRKINVNTFVNFFKKDRDREVQEKLEHVFKRLDELLMYGEKEFCDFEFERSEEKKVNQHRKGAIKAQVNATPSFEASVEESIEDGEAVSRKLKVKSALNLETLKSFLIELINILGINGITFFYDEWSTLSKSDQEVLSKLIRALSSAPLYHWIAYIPYKSTLGVLEPTADLPHTLDLDLQFIYEENNKVCANYFREFINKRLNMVFGTSKFNASPLLRNELIELLVKSSMGNTRDFGVMLNKAWNNYKHDYLATKKNRVISKKHIERAIKSLAEEKMSNLQEKAVSKYSERLWADLVKFVSLKSHTHFCVEMSDKNIDYLKEAEFTDLLYHRLLHLRKKDYSPKDGDGTRLSIYSVDVSVLFFEIFETRSTEKKINLVTDVDTIHNQVRRYIFNVEDFVSQYRIEQGKQIKCINPDCKKIITEDMKYALQNNVCTFCGTMLPHSEQALNVALSRP
ncbi:hypothetical protein EKA14_24660 [Bacillus mycoides]|nr:hypothetical protein EKA14_24660 [Bacillus mycoides]